MTAAEVRRTDGSARDPRDCDFALEPLPGDALHETLHALRRIAPIAPCRFGGQPAFVITGHAALLEAFADVDAFPPHRMYRASFEPAIGESFISMPERERHLVYRRLATPAFRSRAITRFEEAGLRALAHELVDAMLERAPQGPWDLVAELTARFPYKVITRLLGLPREREDAFHAWALALLRFREEPDAARAAAKEFTAYLQPVVAARRREPREDVISELLAAGVDGRRLSDTEIESHIRLLFPTGGETTHGSLGNLLSLVLSRPELQERLREDPSLVPAAVEEGLRLETPIAVLPRLAASQRVRFQDIDLPADAWVLFAIAGANRDPAVFADPDRFDLSRPSRDALTFGRGVKSCPGAHLARRNLQVAMEVLLERLPRLELIDAEAARPRQSVLRAPAALRVRPAR
ncbi:MAG: cytochrome P450 [Myxococcota bacterium]